MSCQAVLPEWACVQPDCARQVWQCLPKPQHGSEAAGTGLAGLQKTTGQGGEIRGEREDGTSAGQATPGVGEGSGEGG